MTCNRDEMKTEPKPPPNEKEAPAAFFKHWHRHYLMAVTKHEAGKFSKSTKQLVSGKNEKAESNK